MPEMARNGLAQFDELVGEVMAEWRIPGLNPSPRRHSHCWWTRGRVDWEAPMRAVLPKFRLRDPVATEQASLRDLLTHRTGLPRHDWVHMGGHLDNAGMLTALRLEPSKPFRSAYQYQNLMYLVAGLVLDRVSGERWEDFVRTRILLPLGMERATTSLEDMLARHPDCAMPHAVIDGEQRRITAA